MLEPASKQSSYFSKEIGPGWSNFVQKKKKEKNSAARKIEHARTTMLSVQKLSFMVVLQKRKKEEKRKEKHVHRPTSLHLLSPRRGNNSKIKHMLHQRPSRYELAGNRSTMLQRSSFLRVARGKSNFHLRSPFSCPWPTGFGGILLYFLFFFIFSFFFSLPTFFNSSTNFISGINIDAAGTSDVPRRISRQRLPNEIYSRLLSRPNNRLQF